MKWHRPSDRRLHEGQVQCLLSHGVLRPAIIYIILVLRRRRRSLLRHTADRGTWAALSVMICDEIRTNDNYLTTLILFEAFDGQLICFSLF